MGETVDAVVVGGGILGTSLAHALARDGARVTLIEEHAIGSGTSSHTFAWLNATSKHDDAHYHRLNAAGLARHRELARTWGDDRLGLGGIGMLTWSGNGLPRRRTRLAGPGRRWAAKFATAFPSSGRCPGAEVCMS